MCCLAFIKTKFKKIKFNYLNGFYEWAKIIQKLSTEFQIDSGEDSIDIFYWYRKLLDCHHDSQHKDTLIAVLKFAFFIQDAF